MSSNDRNNVDESAGEQPFKKKRRGGWDVQNPVWALESNNNPTRASLTNVLSTLMQQKNQQHTPSSSAGVGVGVGTTGTFNNPLTSATSLIGLPTLAAAAPKADHRIYIGSINYEVTESQIRKLFEPFGQIVKVDMSVDPINGKTKGFCFIEYQNLASVQAAMVMDGFELANRKIKVGRPANATQTPVQPIPDLNTAAAPILILPQLPLSLLASSTTTSSSLHSFPVSATISTTDATGIIDTTAKKISIKNVHTAFSESEVKSIFTAFGGISSTLTLPNGGRDKNEVSIEFKTPSSAQQALALNGFHLGGEPLVITLSN